MRTPVKTFISIAALGSMLALGTVVGQAMADQPRMQNALGALRSARAELQAALPDKGGHRVRAIALVDEAIDQVRAGIEAGRR